MLTRLRRLFAPTAEIPPLLPDEVVSVVGDVHGCAAQLRALLPQLPGRIVLVGDLVDRGEDSAEVLALVRERSDVTVLMGNHEEMLLGFLDAPLAGGPRWLRHGGLQTLASFGVAGDLDTGSLERRRDDLALAMGDGCIDWLRARPLVMQSGNLAVSHAGGDPHRALDAQQKALVWGHRDFGKVPRRDGMWMARGHVVVTEPVLGPGVLSLDTGAYAGGPLTAAVLGDGPPRFISAAA